MRYKEVDLGKVVFSRAMLGITVSFTGWNIIPPLGNHSFKELFCKSSENDSLPGFSSNNHL